MKPLQKELKTNAWMMVTLYFEFLFLMYTEVAAEASPPEFSDLVFLKTSSAYITGFAKISRELIT